MSSIKGTPFITKTNQAINIPIEIYIDRWCRYAIDDDKVIIIMLTLILRIQNIILVNIETIHRWTAAFKKFNFRKYLLFASMIPGYLTNPDVREYTRRFAIQANLHVFYRHIFDHYRIVFEKIKD